MKFGGEGKADSPKEKLNNPSRRTFLKQFGIGAGALALAGGIPGLEIIAEAAQKIGLLERNLTDKQLVEYWEAHKKKIQELVPVLKEQIAFLESTYKETFISILVKVKSDLAFFESMVKIDSQLQAQGVTMEQFISSSVSRSMVANSFDMLSLYWDPENLKIAAQNSYRENLKKVKYKGFDKLPKETDQGMKKMFEDSFPSQWLYGNVVEFEYVDKEEYRQTFQVGGTAQSAGITAVFKRSSKDEKEKITFYKMPKGADPSLLSVAILYTVPHELAHKHSWETSNTLTIQERIAMLAEVTQRLGAEDRFKSYYVEEMTPAEGKAEGDTLEDVKYKQAVEYWAEIVREFQGDKERFIKDHPRDYEMVKRWIDLIMSRYGK
jgi:hypothetical protein